jgi:hypothetical protein
MFWLGFEAALVIDWSPSIAIKFHTLSAGSRADQAEKYRHLEAVVTSRRTHIR